MRIGGGGGGGAAPLPPPPPPWIRLCYTIKWSIACHAHPYTNETKKCDLCLTEKLLIMNADKRSLLYKRPELIYNVE